MRALTQRAPDRQWGLLTQMSRRVVVVGEGEGGYLEEAALGHPVGKMDRFRLLQHSTA